ncbi:MAG: rhomboid family intramembrane serine protease [Candidatus Gracilibacteria bacterium]|nr:rhomboid family intramembrane serine protease [Candidatus Gracilibacteria bacterium]
MKNNYPLSFIFIFISFICTMIGFFYPDFYIFGLNKYFLNEGNYLIFFIQLFLSVFLHGGFFHFFFNSVFIYMFGTSLELLVLGRKKYLYFFIFIVLFNGILITIFSSGNTNTIGISGFCMAILTYYVLELKSRNNMEYKGGITAIVLNLLIGFMPGISLMGHLFGVIGGILFYLYNKEFLKPKMIGEVN